MTAQKQHSRKVDIQRLLAEGCPRLAKPQGLKTVFIAGMHRSGTSATTGMIIKLGLSQSKDVLPAHLFNPGGHFESLELFHANEKILQALGYAWDIPPNAPVSETELHRIRDCGLLDELREQFKEKSFTRDWCDKDPRLAITLPIWDQVLLRKVPVVACIRNPQEVAMSLRLREGMPFELGIILWRLYNENLRDSCQQRECLVLDYALDLKSDTAKTALRIHQFATECGYTVYDDKMSDAASAFRHDYHRNRAAQDLTFKNERHFSQRTQNALQAYEEIRTKPIHEWPAQLEQSSQIREEDAQWLMLYKKSRFQPQLSQATHGDSRIKTNESRWTRLIHDPIGVIRRKAKATLARTHNPKRKPTEPIQ